MSSAIAIFVKTPSLSPVKTRLAATIGEEKAIEFYLMSLRAVEESAKQMANRIPPPLREGVRGRVSGVDHSTDIEHPHPNPPPQGGGEKRVSSFWAVGEEEGLSDPLWSGFETIHTGEGCLGERQHHIYETLLAGHERVLLIGADAPQLSPALLEEAIAALDTDDFVIGPARDGGYYLFGGRAPVEKEIWTSVEYSCDTTREKLVNKLPSSPAYLPILSDVDTRDDLQYMTAEMPEIMSNEQKHIVDHVTFMKKNTNIG